MRFLAIVYVSFFLLAACQQEEMLEASYPPPAVGEATVSICFDFAVPSSTRASEEMNLMWEESKVEHLTYAIFQNNLCRELKEVRLTGTSSPTEGGHRYTVQDVPKKWLDSSTEIFAIANAPEKLLRSLLHGKYQVPNDDPVLQRLVTERIDSLAKADIYSSIIQRMYQSNPWPSDNKIHSFSVDGKILEGTGYFTLPSDYRCADYTQFVKHFNDPKLPMEVKNTYEKMWVDLQCRIEKYRGNDVRNKIYALTQKENTDHAIRTALQQDGAFQKYMLWRNQEWTADLNQEAASLASQRIEQPIMAGYHALNEDFPTTIVIPVERIYSRIWFDFHWDAHKDTEAIVVDEIQVHGLMTQTKLFNLGKEAIDNNPANFTTTTCTLHNPQPGGVVSKSMLRPFFADLQRPSYPYHWGEQPQMRLDAAQPAYHTLSVYEQTPTGQVDTAKPPHRCYVYSFQLGGNSLKDDPEIVVRYHFNQEGAGGGTTTIHKLAKARLYDETHLLGKQHHGLLRNYTYQLNCKVTSLSHKLNVQVVAVPWFKVSIEDIPPFE